MKVFLSHLFLFFVSLSFSSTSATLDKPQLMQRRNMPGGYSPVQDLTDEGVQSSAAFAVSKLSEATESYSFLPQLQQSTESTSSPKMKVAKAYQQVVAGMNYRMVIMLEDPQTGSCLGAFAATVYNRFGDLSVSKWSKEVSCEKARAMIESAEEFHQTYQEDFN
jgi:hypothetical protein